MARTSQVGLPGVDPLQWTPGCCALTVRPRRARPAWQRPQHPAGPAARPAPARDTAFGAAADGGVSIDSSGRTSAMRRGICRLGREVLSCRRWRSDGRGAVAGSASVGPSRPLDPAGLRRRPRRRRPRGSGRVGRGDYRSPAGTGRRPCTSWRSNSMTGGSTTATSPGCPSHSTPSSRPTTAGPTSASEPLTSAARSGVADTHLADECSRGNGRTGDPQEAPVRQAAPGPALSDILQLSCSRRLRELEELRSPGDSYRVDGTPPVAEELKKHPRPLPHRRRTHRMSRRPRVAAVGRRRAEWRTGEETTWVTRSPFKMCWPAVPCC
jgi:hypothetical protein